TPPTPAGGAPSTGKNPSPARPGNPAVTMPRASRSAGAPWGTASGDGRHRLLPTRAMDSSIGPPRPQAAPQGVREPAPAPLDHGNDPLGPDAARTRETRTPTTVRSVRLSPCNSSSVPRNGSAHREPRKGSCPRSAASPPPPDPADTS